MRLRDHVCDMEDYALWQSHEIGDERPSPDWLGSDRLLDSALHLVAENEVCGKINGDRLKARAREDGVTAVVLRIEAQHNDPKAATRSSDMFRQLQPITHLCIAARVMLTQNYLWDIPVVFL